MKKFYIIEDNPSHYIKISNALKSIDSAVKCIHIFAGKSPRQQDFKKEDIDKICAAIRGEDCSSWQELIELKDDITNNKDNTFIIIDVSLKQDNKPNNYSKRIISCLDENSFSDKYLLTSGLSPCYLNKFLGRDANYSKTVLSKGFLESKDDILELWGHALKN